MSKKQRRNRAWEQKQQKRARSSITARCTTIVGGRGGGVLFGEETLQLQPPVSSPSHSNPADRPDTQKSQCQRATPRCSVTPHPPSLFCFHRQRAVPPSCLVFVCSAAVDRLGCLFRVADLGRDGHVTSSSSMNVSPSFTAYLLAPTFSSFRRLSSRQSRLQIILVFPVGVVDDRSDRSEYFKIDPR